MFLGISLDTHSVFKIPNNHTNNTDIGGLNDPLVEDIHIYIYIYTYTYMCVYV